MPCAINQTLSGALRIVRRTFRTSPSTLGGVGRTRRGTVSVTSRCARGCLVKICSHRGAIPGFLHGLARSDGGLGRRVHPFVRGGLLRVLRLVYGKRLPFCRGPDNDGRLCRRRTCHIRPRGLGARFSFGMARRRFDCRLRYCSSSAPISLVRRGPIIILASGPTALLLNVSLCAFDRVRTSHLLPFAGGRHVDTSTSLARGCVSGVVVPLTHCRSVDVRKLGIIERGHPYGTCLCLRSAVCGSALLQLSFHCNRRSFSPRPSSRAEGFIFHRRRRRRVIVRCFRHGSATREGTMRLLRGTNLRYVDSSRFGLSSTTPRGGVAR